MAPFFPKYRYNFTFKIEQKAYQLLGEILLVFHQLVQLILFLLHVWEEKKAQEYTPSDCSSQTARLKHFTFQHTFYVHISPSVLISTIQPKRGDSNKTSKSSSESLKSIQLQDLMKTPRITTCNHLEYTATAHHLSCGISRDKIPFIFLTPQTFSTDHQRIHMHIGQLTFPISKEEIQNYCASTLTEVHYDLHEILSGLTQY